MNGNLEANSLWNTFGKQADFQRHINAHPENIEDPQELIDYIVYMKTALEAELQEMLDEIGWKPWATSRHINREGVKSELVDTFQFFMNLCFAVGMDANELLLRHTEKLLKNYKRADEGYDGVSTKCGWCGRALDDSHVLCMTANQAPGPLPAANVLGYCEPKATTSITGWFTQEDLENRK